MLHIAFWILHTVIKGEFHVYCLRLTFHLLFTLFSLYFLLLMPHILMPLATFVQQTTHFLFFKEKKKKKNWWAFYLKQLLTKAVNASDQGDIILLNIRILKPLPFKTLINIQMQRCIKPGCFNVWLSHNIVTKTPLHAVTVANVLHESRPYCCCHYTTRHVTFLLLAVNFFVRFTASDFTL